MVRASFDVSYEPPSSPANVPVLQWHNAPWDHIKGDLSRALKSWNLCEFHTVDDAVEQLQEACNGVIEKHVKSAPIKQRSRVPWWSMACVKAYSAKQTAFESRAGDPDAYKRAVRRCRKVQRKAYRKWQKKIRDKILSMDQSDSSFWQLASQIGGLDVPKSNSAPSVNDIAAHFQDKMSNGKDQKAPDFEAFAEGAVTLRSWKVRFRSVLRALKKLNPKKSSGGIARVFYTECADVLAPSVTKLYRLITRLGKYPELWKTGRVTPLHKRGSMVLPTNYRPVTSLDALSIGFESVIYDQFEAWIDKFIPDSQFVFSKSCGTDDYGFYLGSTMLDTLERRKEGLLIPLDVKGAFDRVWWSRLKKRLGKAGMRGTALSLMRDYLFRRFIRVVAGAVASAKTEIFSGVPQGAKLSPKLWNFDIRDLPDAVGNDVDFMSYADDCNLWCRFRTGLTMTVLVSLIQ